MPVINENDTTATDELTFGDNDVLAAQVAILLGAAWLLLLTDRDGLYAAGPDGPELLGDVPAGHPARTSSRWPTSARPGRGRGGIASKVASASMATGGGVTTRDRLGHRRRASSPRVASGTTWAPASRRRRAASRAFKLWLRHAKPTMGRVAVDAGAARALRERGTSLLAVGVVGVRGRLPGRRRGRGGRREGGAWWARASRRCRPTRCASVAGLKSDAGAASGCPTPRPRSSTATSSCSTARSRTGPWCNAHGHLERVAADVARGEPGARAACRGAHRDAVARGDGRRPRAAHRRDPAREPPGRAGGQARRRPRRRSSTGCCSTRTAWPTWRPASARSRRCPTRSARSTAAGRLPNGLDVVRRRVPLGVIAVIYEGRPNVTADAVALCLKSGNAIILRGSRIAAPLEPDPRPRC